MVARLKFAKYDVVPLEIVFVEPASPWGPNSFSRVDITDLSLKVLINDSTDDATPLVEQTSWTKNTADNTFTGNLNLNTAAMNTYMSADKTPYFEVVVTDTAGARVKALSEVCDVVLGVAQVTTTAPDVSRIYLDSQEIEGLYFPRQGKAGETLTLTSPAGTFKRILGVRDDGTEQDDIIAV